MRALPCLVLALTCRGHFQKVTESGTPYTTGGSSSPGFSGGFFLGSRLYPSQTPEPLTFKVSNSWWARPSQAPLSCTCSLRTVSRRACWARATSPSDRAVASARRCKASSSTCSRDGVASVRSLGQLCLPRTLSLSSDSYPPNSTPALVLT